MASEYLKQKYKDVKPDEKKVLTPEEKRKNWWDYHKWHLAAGIALAAMIVSIFWSAFSQVKPDYQLAFVGSSLLPDDTAAALKNELASLGEDLNGDGKVSVSLVQYVADFDADAEMAAASQVTLMADILEGESYFFLLEDPESFQAAYHVLCYLDGSLPAEEASADGTYLPWSQCPVLANLDLGNFAIRSAALDEPVTGSSQDVLSQYYFARRGFWTEQSPELLAGYDALWEKLTEGAIAP